MSCAWDLVAGQPAGGGPGGGASARPVHQPAVFTPTIHPPPTQQNASWSILARKFFAISQPKDRHGHFFGLASWTMAGVLNPSAVCGRRHELRTEVPSPRGKDFRSAESTKLISGLDRFGRPLLGPPPNGAQALRHEPRTGVRQTGSCRRYPIWG